MTIASIQGYCAEMISGRSLRVDWVGSWNVAHLGGMDLSSPLRKSPVHTALVLDPELNPESEFVHALVAILQFATDRFEPW